MWHYNNHPDFVPYYDKLKGKWAVSIQYLGVWYFPTEEKATESIERLKQYRLDVLAEVERKNQEYYERIARQEQKKLKELHENKTEEKKWYIPH